MKVTMLTTLCGPSGNADPGGVIDLPDSQAKVLLEKNDSGGPYARRYDRDKDAKPRHVGLYRYQKTDE